MFCFRNENLLRLHFFVLTTLCLLANRTTYTMLSVRPLDVPRVFVPLAENTVDRTPLAENESSKNNAHCAIRWSGKRQNQGTPQYTWQTACRSVVFRFGGRKYRWTSQSNGGSLGASSGRSSPTPGSKATPLTAARNSAPRCVPVQCAYFK